MKHFINILDHPREELESLLDWAAHLKSRKHQGIEDRLLLGKSLGMFFEKPSTRTRVSLEAAMASLGGNALFIESGKTRLGEREPLKDVARVMSRYVDIISIRTFEHQVVETLAEWSTVPVINALSDNSHPTQALADLLTMRERFGNLKGLTLTFVGDGNNVARSLASLCGQLDVNFILACPDGFSLDKDFLHMLKSKCPKMNYQEERDPNKAIQRASAIYTDVWTSMGQEEESAARKKVFLPYQLNEGLIRNAPEEAIILHCLPAHRGEEITDEVIESANSAVFDQAENRMHINRALLTRLIIEGT